MPVLIARMVFSAAMIALALSLSDCGGAGDSSGGVIVGVGTGAAPSITSAVTAAAAENQAVAYTVTASDPKSDPITYALAGGANQARFTINASTGVVGLAMLVWTERAAL
jgi:hypothetical protein